MKNKKKNKNFKSKLALFSLATVLPMATSGLALLSGGGVASADSSSQTPYLKSYVEEISLSNNNFNSSSSTSALISPSNWTSSGNTATSGAIHTGNPFEDAMKDTLYLGANPKTSGSDPRILMINSRTANSGTTSFANQGYRSKSLTLSANSFYSFQVAFKSDTNYKTTTKYNIEGTITEENKSSFKLTKTSFTANPVKPFLLKEDGTAEDQFVSFRYKNRNVYLKKVLDTGNTFTIESKTEDGTDLQNIEFFYDDGSYYGFLYDNGDGLAPVYIKKTFATETETAGKINVQGGATAYSCKTFKFVPNEGSVTEGNFEVILNSDTDQDGNPATFYYTRSETQEPFGEKGFGSIYLDGLKDSDGKTVEAQFEKVSSSHWVTFYFFVATGDESQTVDLNLWLGTAGLYEGGASRNGKDVSGGVVFFDDVHVNQFSENTFWKTYANYFDRSYSTEKGKVNCTNLYDLRNNSAKIDEKDLYVPNTDENEPAPEEENLFNFDFEKGISNSSPSSYENWHKENTKGFAQVVKVSSPNTYSFGSQQFDFVGSDLSCEVEFENVGDEDFPRLKVTTTENDYALALVTDNNTSKVTTNNALKIESKKIYKISARYKINDLSNGKAYMFVKENDILLKDLVNEGKYTPAAEVASSGISSNADNKFSNNYGTIEFYVKGNTFYDSAINISLGLGNGEETSTGMVLFDNIEVSYASSEDFQNASNKIELGNSELSTLGVTNGDFDLVTSSAQNFGLYTPQNWTITNGGDGVSFSGVISTSQNSYAEYQKKFEDYQKQHGTSNQENPYFWASYSNPKNSDPKEEVGNVLVLGNRNTNKQNAKTWQKLKSESFTVNAPTSDSTGIYKLSFKYKTTNLTGGIKLSLYQENVTTPFYVKTLDSNAEWSTFEVFLKSFYGETKIYFEIDFETTKNNIDEFAYFDKFDLESNLQDPQNSSSLDEVVNFSNFGLELENSADLYNFSTTDGEIKTAFDPDKSPFYDPDAVGEKFFFIGLENAETSSITSNFKIDLKSKTYYALSFKVKTYFKDASTPDENEDASNYGVTFGLTGFDYVKKVVTNDEKYSTYTIYIYNSSDEVKQTQLYMALVCNKFKTGAMAIYDIQLDDTIQQATYDEIKADFKTKSESEDFDVNNDKVFVSEAQEASDEEENTPNEDENTTNGESFNWLLIPTLITALAIVIAVIGYFLRKVKIKKIQIKRRNSYDRKTSANVDFIKRKAAEERDKELKTLETSKAKFEQELVRLEDTHKSKIVGLREKDKDAVSKETDKEFKTFAKKRTVIAEKIEVLDKQIEEINSPEHLLSLERKIFAEQETARRELEKTSKKAEKEKAKNVEKEMAKKTETDAKRSGETEGKKKSKRK